MGIFSNIFYLFDKNKAHRDLQDAYAKLHELATLLHNNISILIEMQRQLVKSSATGAIGLQKTLFIEESLNKQLKELAEQTERRFLEAEENIKKSEPINDEERDELRIIIDFLKKLKALSPALEKLNRIVSNKEKLLFIETSLRNITKLSKEFYDNINRAANKFKRKILEHEISPLLKRIYTSPERHPKDNSILIYRVTEKELRALEDESIRINACQDPNYKIQWRRWWRDIQIPEIDKATLFKDPHINVTIKLFGEPKKDIHLLLKAA